LLFFFIEFENFFSLKKALANNTQVVTDLGNQLAATTTQIRSPRNSPKKIEKDKENNSGHGMKNHEDDVDISSTLSRLEEAENKVHSLSESKAELELVNFLFHILAVINLYFVYNFHFT